MPTIKEQIAQLESAIAALEAQRANLGDAVVGAALGPMQEKLAALSAHPLSSTPRAGMEGERKLVTIMFADISGSPRWPRRWTLKQCLDRLESDKPPG
jgi:class 3 adenylate cyclase